jgi:hypothetical protein
MLGEICIEKSYFETKDYDKEKIEYFWKRLGAPGAVHKMREEIIKKKEEFEPSLPLDFQLDAWE